MPEYSPLDIGELANSIVNALLRQPCGPLPPDAEFNGSGLYAIYYYGDYPVYRPIAEANRGEACSRPIYVGRATPSGGRKGWEEGEVPPEGPFLLRRLREHAESIRPAENLRITDFTCRYLITDPLWIPLGEKLLVQRYQPVWNLDLDGFGNHDPGLGRQNQRRSPWDEVHKGRRWAEELAPCRLNAERLVQLLRTRVHSSD